METDELIIQQQKLEIQSLPYVDLNLKFLIKSGYHIVPSPSTALITLLLFEGRYCKQNAQCFFP